ncbi:transcription elongation factor S-II [Nemania diffusa]|nr:transcription elongation factor S-II [Nemania diffusa]
MPPLARAQLLAAARAFCDSFARKRPVEEILSHFSSSPPSPSSISPAPPPAATAPATDDGSESGILVREHGLPQLAPFLGRDFRGLRGARRYFEIVGACLRYEDMRFVAFVAGGAAEEGEGEGESDENEGGQVAVRGRARFTWRETGQSWDETFVYVLCFDARAKVRRYEIWADSGAAYLARRGELASSGEQDGERRATE